MNTLEENLYFIVNICEYDSVFDGWRRHEKVVTDIIIMTHDNL
jgi:hypothetical protein